MNYLSCEVYIMKDEQVINFSENIKNILKAMMGADVAPVSIKGTQEQLDLLTRTLVQEKRYLEAFQQYGSEHPRTEKERSSLERQVDKFEQTMKIDWPLR
jgi:hypothetical protein|tara:strand:+ start:79 stop:378 length:300 start_codon:yes stop_codon:yes gene_type:complete